MINGCFQVSASTESFKTADNIHIQTEKDDDALEYIVKVKNNSKTLCKKITILKSS